MGNYPDTRTNIRRKNTQGNLVLLTNAESTTGHSRAENFAKKILITVFARAIPTPKRTVIQNPQSGVSSNRFLKVDTCNYNVEYLIESEHFDAFKQFGETRKIIIDEVKVDYAESHLSFDVDIAIHNLVFAYNFEKITEQSTNHQLGSGQNPGQRLTNYSHRFASSIPVKFTIPKQGADWVTDFSSAYKLCGESYSSSEMIRLTDIGFDPTFFFSEPRGLDNNTHVLLRTSDISTKILINWGILDIPKENEDGDDTPPFHVAQNWSDCIIPKSEITIVKYTDGGTKGSKDEPQVGFKCLRSTYNRQIRNLCAKSNLDKLRRAISLKDMFVNIALDPTQETLIISDVVKKSKTIGHYEPSQSIKLCSFVLLIKGFY